MKTLIIVFGALSFDSFSHLYQKKTADKNKKKKKASSETICLTRPFLNMVIKKKKVNIN